MGTHKEFLLTMKVLVILCLAVSALAVPEALRELLKSPKDTLKLYSAYKAEENLEFRKGEDGMRFRLFRANAEFVADINEQSEDTVFGLNFFSAMTPEEKQQYLGLNITGHEPNLAAPASSGFRAPAEKLWTNEGAVTQVFNQGSCGSCWTWGAVGGLETRYKLASGKLRKFAEQEYLDCTYSDSKDGCRGGWPDHCYDYSKRNGGRLAASKDYTYRAKDSSCRAGSYKNAAISHKIMGHVSVGSTESANIKALSTGSLSVAFEVTDYFHQYRGGVIKDTTCRGRPNHAVTAVGYSPKFVLVKNSWGTGWGDKGFVKFARGHSNCGLFAYASYPKLESTGRSDPNPSDGATPYRPDGDDGPAPNPTCEDKAMDCTKAYCKWESMRNKWCQKTCGTCNDDGNDDGECPNGTVRCNDGICRHEHMCPH